MKAWVQHSHFICCNNLAPFCVWQTVIMTIIWANTSSTHLTFSWISVWSEYHNLLLWTPVLLENGTMPSSPSWFLFPQWSLQVCCLLLLKCLLECSIRVNPSGCGTMYLSTDLTYQQTRYLNSWFLYVINLAFVWNCIAK